MITVAGGITGRPARRNHRALRKSITSPPMSSTPVIGVLPEAGFSVRLSPPPAPEGHYVRA